MARVKGAIGNRRTIEAKPLRQILKPIYASLEEHGISGDDMPSSKEMVNRILTFIDNEAIEEWVNEYVKWVENKP